MSISLSAESAEILRVVVASGVYPSEREALEVAVALLKRQEAFRRDVEAGIAASRAGSVLPAEEFFDQLDLEIAEIEGATKSNKQ